MDFVKEELPGCQVKLEYNFTADEVTAAFKQVYVDLNKRGQVRGFRAGKAPRALLLRHYGEDTISSATWVDLVGEHLQEQLEALDLFGEPEIPEIADLALAEGEPLTFSALCTVRPTVELGDLSGIEVLRPLPEATEEEVAKVLEDLRESHAQEDAVTRDTVQDGDAVDVALTVTVEGEEDPVDELEQTVIVGKGGYFPPIDEKLVGTKVQDTVEMDVTYPEDYHDESLAGKTAKVVGKVLDLRERHLPAIADELAQKVDSEKFATLDDLRTEIKRQLDGERSEYSRDEVETQIAHELLRRFAPDVPELMVEEIAHGEEEDFSEKLEHAGLSLEAFHDVTGVSADRYAAMERMRARRLIQVQLILRQITMDRELGEVTAEEAMQEAEIFAKERNLDPRMITNALALQPEFHGQISDRVRRRKTYDSLIADANLRDVPVEEYRSKREQILHLEEDDEFERLAAEEAAAPAAQESDAPLDAAAEAADTPVDSGAEIAPEPEAAPEAETEAEPEPAGEAETQA